MIKRIAAFLIALVLLVGMLPQAFAEEAAGNSIPESEPIFAQPLVNTVADEYSVMALASTQTSIMLFDYADNGNYTTVLNSQVTCAYKPNGTGTTRTAYIKNLGWHFARYGGVPYADDPLYCIEPWRSYAASTSGNSVDREVTLDGSGSTTGSNVWYALPAARREAVGLILLYKYVNGQSIKCTVKPTLGMTQKNNPKIQYTIDFDVTPHLLRHTYITNLISAGVDPKTVQYLAGHENSKTTMDIYAKVKYNKPEELFGVVNGAFHQAPAQ